MTAKLKLLCISTALFASTSVSLSLSKYSTKMAKVTKARRCRDSSCLTFEEHKCSDNATFKSTKCVCNFGFEFVEGKCIVRQIKTIDCGENEILDGSKCVCIENFFRNTQNVCASLRPPSHKSIPDCGPGYTWNEKQKVCVLTPPSDICPEGRLPEGGCIDSTCIPGFKFDDYKGCVPICLSDEIYNEEKDICERQHTITIFTPQKCDLDKIWDYDTCVPKALFCDQSQFYNPTTDKCECIKGCLDHDGRCQNLVTFNSDAYGFAAIISSPVSTAVCPTYNVRFVNPFFSSRSASRLATFK